MSEQHLLLKWGTLKGWDVTGNEAALACLRRYHEESTSLSVMAQHDTDTQKQALYDLIDAMPDDAEIINDWSGDHYDKEQAKQYIREYGQPVGAVKASP